MSEERLTSNKLDIEEKIRLSESDEKLKETYRQIPEDSNSNQEGKSTSDNNKMVRENGETPLADGADEKMLGSDDKESLAVKDVEVKFISGDKNTNGDAKIDIGNFEKPQAFSGMTKEELMKYANDPFWVRLRWILFILFWAVWIGMLVGAISIIVFAPKCSAPTPLVWWKKGPLITITGSESEDEINAIKEVKAQGVVYELNADETYSVDTPKIKERIEELVKKYNAHQIQVVLDLTPNYVKVSDELFQRASASGASSDDLDAFYHSANVNNNWLKYDTTDNQKAWKKINNIWFLSQFDENIDLNMKSEIAQNKFIKVIQDLASYGVKGFRLNNAKHFLVNPEFKDETVAKSPSSFVTGDYHFYNHHETTYVDGLVDVLHNFTKAALNATGGEGFLTIRDDVGHNIDKFMMKNSQIIGISLPRFDFINTYLEKLDGVKNAEHLNTGVKNIKEKSDLSTLWMQVAYSEKDFTRIGASAYNIFTSLLPGVQIAPISAFKPSTLSDDDFKKLQDARESPVFQHGSFNYTLSADNNAFGYTRVKSGNPGYFVAVNPSESDIKANFTSPLLSSELSVYLLSDGFTNDTMAKGKVPVHSVPLSRRSAAIFTFVYNN